ncbi:MAG: thiopurine S-methyltransferase [Chromatiales bacterium]|nr:thiopurine S-methyltransferase [Chromatiales bacterium]
MEAEFWRQRWQKNEIGFHQDEINVHLQTCWQKIEVRPNSTVFVPLCGKSLDLLWLRSQGYTVIGIEISALAVEAFFVENELTPEVSEVDKFRRWECDGITILEGDFFDLQPGHLSGVETVYDRASLVALPPEMRKAYAEHLFKVLPGQVDILLVTMQYPQEEMSGPPFAVEEEEVHTLYHDHYQMSCLDTLDILEENPRFRAKGVTHMEEKVFLLRNGG